MSEEDGMETIVSSDRATLVGVEQFDPGDLDIDQLAVGLIESARRDRWRCAGCRQSPVLAYVEHYRMGEGSTFALCETCLFDRLGRNAAPAERDELREIGDLMRSGAARLTAWIGEHHADLPPDLAMVSTEVAAALDGWDAARRRSR